MTTQVMLLVLFGALLHASWNAIVKSGDNKLLQAGLVAGGGALIALPILPFVPAIAPDSIPWLIGSITIHQFYFFLVAAAYRAGDLGHAYPLMRGSAPLIVALASATVVGERLTPIIWAGIILICCGILFLALHRHASGKATTIALCNAVVIAFYTLMDGMGARASGSPLSYVLWLHVFSAPVLLAWLCWHDAAAVRATIRQRGLFGLAGGAASIGSYGLALWAMTLAPLAAVAALRETSVLFAIVIATFILGERGGARRIGAAILIVSGTMALRLA